LGIRGFGLNFCTKGLDWPISDGKRKKERLELGQGGGRKKKFPGEKVEDLEKKLLAYF